MFKFDTHSSLSLALAAVALAIGTASAPVQAASVDQPATAAQQRKMADCKSEFTSLRDICASEAGWGQPVLAETLSPEQRQAMNQEESRYRQAVSVCNGLLGNNRPICVSRAGTPSSLAGTY